MLSATKRSFYVAADMSMRGHCRKERKQALGFKPCSFGKTIAPITWRNGFRNLFPDIPRIAA